MVSEFEFEFEFEFEGKLYENEGELRQDVIIKKGTRRRFRLPKFHENTMAKHFCPPIFEGNMSHLRSYTILSD